MTVNKKALTVDQQRLDIKSPVPFGVPKIVRKSSRAKCCVDCGHPWWQHYLIDGCQVKLVDNSRCGCGMKQPRRTFSPR